MNKENSCNNPAIMTSRSFLAHCGRKGGKEVSEEGREGGREGGREYQKCVQIPTKRQRERRQDRDGILSPCVPRQQYRDCVIWAREYQHSRNVSFSFVYHPYNAYSLTGFAGFIYSLVGVICVCFRLCIRGQAPKKSIMCYVM